MARSPQWRSTSGDIQNTSNPLAHLNSVPADGTLLDASGGGVFVVAGGAPLYVSSYAAIGGQRGGVAIDEWDIQNTANPAAHLRSVPADGTLLAASGGGVFEVVGGAPLFVSAWAAIGGMRPYVVVDEWDIDNIANPAAHLNPVPNDGTQINAGTTAYVVAGGSPLRIATCVVGSTNFCSRSTAVDPWDIANITNPAAHLNPSPTEGTLIQALPSSHYWKFHLGGWLSVSAQSLATAVTDAAVTSFPVDAPPSITSPTSATFIKGSPSSFTPTATGFPAPTITESGSLPAGVSFAGGVLSGTPTQAGTFPITLTASNGIGVDVTQSFTLTVVPLAITSASLPAGTAGTAYSTTLTASGGNAPYKWKVISAQKLPKGLKLSATTGQITGTPKAAGTATVTIQVRDTKTKTTPKTQNVATATLTITIS